MAIEIRYRRDLSKPSYSGLRITASDTTDAPHPFQREDGPVFNNITPSTVGVFSTLAEAAAALDAVFERSTWSLLWSHGGRSADCWIVTANTDIKGLRQRLRRQSGAACQVGARRTNAGLFLADMTI